MGRRHGGPGRTRKSVHGSSSGRTPWSLPDHGGSSDGRVKGRCPDPERCREIRSWATCAGCRDGVTERPDRSHRPVSGPRPRGAGGPPATGWLTPPCRTRRPVPSSACSRRPLLADQAPAGADDRLQVAPPGRPGRHRRPIARAFGSEGSELPLDMVGHGERARRVWSARDARPDRLRGHGGRHGHRPLPRQGACPCRPTRADAARRAVHAAPGP